MLLSGQPHQRQGIYKKSPRTLGIRFLAAPVVTPSLPLDARATTHPIRGARGGGDPRGSSSGGGNGDQSGQPAEARVADAQDVWCERRWQLRRSERWWSHVTSSDRVWLGHPLATTSSNLVASMAFSDDDLLWSMFRLSMIVFIPTLFMHSVVGFMMMNTTSFTCLIILW